MALSLSPSVTTPSFNRHTQQTKAILLSPLASSSDGSEFSVFAWLSRSHCETLYSHFTLHQSGGICLSARYGLIFFFFFLYVGFQCIGSLCTYVIPLMFPINYRITSARGVTANHSWLNIILNNVHNYLKCVLNF